MTAEEKSSDIWSLTTSRLHIRKATRNDRDVAFLYELWTNPQVMTNVGFPHGLRVSRSEIATKIASQGSSVFDRMMVVERKDTCQAIGECNMKLPNEDGVSTTDVKVLPEHWGNKYGVEIKRGLLEHLFLHTDCKSVEATPNVENSASIRMQEAVGGVRVGEQTYQFPVSMREYTCPVRHYIYRVDRSVWERGRPSPPSSSSRG